jgi:hypothetical protein
MSWRSQAGPPRELGMLMLLSSLLAKKRIPQAIIAASRIARTRTPRSNLMLSTSFEKRFVTNYQEN